MTAYAQLKEFPDRATLTCHRQAMTHPGTQLTMVACASQAAGSTISPLGRGLWNVQRLCPWGPARRAFAVTAVRHPRWSAHWTDQRSEMTILAR